MQNQAGFISLDLLVVYYVIYIIASEGKSLMKYFEQPYDEVFLEELYYHANKFLARSSPRLELPRGCLFVRG